MSMHSLFKTLLAVSLAFTVACTGADGKDGADGANGMDGTNGTNGTNGAEGPEGPAGPDGANGANGADGADGANGMDGADGADGANGADGLCANATPLEITGLDGIPEGGFYDEQTYTLTLLTNAADVAALNVSVVGSSSGMDFSLTYNNDATFTMITGEPDRGDANFMIVATDGCSIATYDLAFDEIKEYASQVNVVNLFEDDISPWTIWNDAPEGADTFYLIGSSFSGVPATAIGGEYSIKAGNNTIKIFAEDAVDSPDEEPALPEDFFGEFDVQIDPDKYYSLIVMPGDMGIEYMLVDMGPGAEEDSASIVAYHNVEGAGEVDVYVLNPADMTQTEVISDLAFGATSAAVEAPAGDLILGLDLDGDAVVDLRFEMEAEDEHRYMINVNEPSSACISGDLELFIFDMDLYGFSSDIFTLSPAVPAVGSVDVDPATGDVSGEQVAEAVPYEVAYENNEVFGAGSTSYRVINAPAGTSQITMGILLDVEEDGLGCYDDLTITDGADAEIFNGCGEGFCLEVVVPGDIAKLGVTSDFSTNGSYTISAISFE